MKCYNLIFNIHIAISLFLFTSCNQHSQEIERINITPEIITDELYISRNCKLIKTTDLFYISDVKENDGFIKIYHSNGSFDTHIGKIGNGPEEFTTPYAIPYKTNDVLIWNRWGRYNSAITQNTDTGKVLIPISTPFINENVASLQTDLAGNFITFEPTKKEGIITLFSKEGKDITAAGKLPYPQTISNIREAFSGNILYNPYHCCPEKFYQSESWTIFSSSELNEELLS